MHHTEALRRMQKHFGSPPGLLLWQIEWFAEHVDQTFDVTFYDREPLLAVSLTKWFAREWYRQTYRCKSRAEEDHSSSMDRIVNQRHKDGRLATAVRAARPASRRHRRSRHRDER